MEYTKEGFIKLYDEYRQAFHNHADALTYEDRLKFLDNVLDDNGISDEA